MVGLVAAALVWLMAAYAFETSSAFVAPVQLALALGSLALVVGGMGLLVGVRPRAVVTVGSEALRVERGREQVRLPYEQLAGVEVVAASLFHRHYRHYAAVRPFLGAPTTDVLLVRTRSGPLVALGLEEKDRIAFQRLVEARALEHAADPARAVTGSQA